MTAMFRPPIAAANTIRWWHVCGLGPDAEPLWAQLRGQQLAVLNRYAPFTLALIVVDCAGLFWLMADVYQPGLAIAWTAAMIGFGALWSLRWWRTRRLPDDSQATRRQFWLVSAEVAGFGIAWAAVVLHLLPMVDVGGQMVLVLLSATTMGAGGFAAAMLPVCGCAMVAGIAAATVIGLPGWSPLATPTVALALLGYAVLIGRGIIVNSFAGAARIRAEAADAEASETIGQLLYEFEAHGSDWLIEVDAQGRLTHASPRLCEASGRSARALLGTPLVDLIGPDRRDAAVRGAMRTLGRQFAARSAFRDLVVPVTVGSEVRWWSLSGTPRFAGRTFAGYRGVGSDVTAARRAADRIAELARFDPLTGLANRALLCETIGDALAGPGCALLLIDLDHFKQVNDVLGHLAGDALLRRIAVVLRELAGPAATVARLGGDEFAVVLSPPDHRRTALLASRLVRALAEPQSLGGRSVTLGTSIGYAFGPADGGTVDALLRAADLALGQVKGSGRGAARRFRPVLHHRAEERRALEADLAGALGRGELSLAYQPIVEASDERIVGFEALLRWHHPVLGNIPPVKFIPVAEATGQIIAIGEWVLQQACREAANWPADIRIAVNLSVVQFDDPHLPTVIAEALAVNGIAPDRLELEVTESVFLCDRPATTTMLARLAALGVRFALDDFGTGYSSLGYLRRREFSRIKIDRSFVQRAAACEAESTAIVRAIVGLATSLGMATTAEGTETRAEFEVCRNLGCAQVQGYLFGRPMPARDAAALVSARTPGAVPLPALT